MNSERYINLKNLCSKELSQVENKMFSSISVREPLNSSILEFLKAPSKRIRPLLAILYLKAQGKEVDLNQIALLTAIELMHNASLIHDDIIDESDYRRGIENISSRFGNRIGVICGDYLLSAAMKIVLNLGCNDITKKIVETLNLMCIGEINQNFDRYKIGTIEDYIEKSKQKTAYLFDAAVECGMILADKKYESKNFGLNFGIAFQIRDDLLNVINKKDLKPVQSDIEQGIYTAPVIYSGSVDELSEGVEKTKVLLNNYITDLYNLINDFEENIYTQALRELVELLKI